MSDADVELGPVDYVVVRSRRARRISLQRWGATGVVAGLDCSGNRELSMTLPVWTWRAGLGRAECLALEGLAPPEGIER